MKIGNYEFKKSVSEIDYSVPSDIDQKYIEAQKSGKRLVLGTLVARSGTRWVCDIFSAHPNATGVTERYALPESFYRYITYHQLPIDTSGIISLLKKGIVEDWQKADISLVFSPYFSHGIEELVNQLRPEEVIIGLAEPRFTVQSIYNKGVFEEELFYTNTEKVIGYQPNVPGQWSHFLGRIIPSGSEYEVWKDLTRIGKITWWGNRIMSDIHKQLVRVPREKIYIFNLPDADQKYAYYLTMAKHFNLFPLLTEKAFLSLKEKTVRSSDNVSHEWSEQEVSEFDVHSKEWLEIYAKLCAKKLL